MKVLMLNGSWREKGCTYTALTIVADALKEEGVDSEIVFVGKDAVNGNINELIKSLKEKCAQSDGFVFGAPVYYASPSGEIQVVLDRLFGAAGDELRFKPAAVVTSARRAGTTSTLDVLAKYPTINQMPLVSSCYWSMVHGSAPEDVREDEEGVAVMKTLGKNMAWLIKSIEAGKAAGVKQPEDVDKPQTNFIR
jgi:multimeric flavodoxin WrbA